MRAGREVGRGQRSQLGAREMADLGDASVDAEQTTLLDAMADRLLAQPAEPQLSSSDHAMLRRGGRGDCGVADQVPDDAADVDESERFHVR